MSNKQKKNTKTSKASKASVHESETSVGTELLCEKVSQGTKKRKRKSAVSDFVSSGRGKSADIINIDAMMTSRMNSNESFLMSIDDEYDNLPSSPAGGYYFPLQSLKQVTEKEKSYVIYEKFNYTMNLLNSKVSTLYKLYRYISDQQQGNSKLLEKLVTLDELSDYF
ncbi:hypothetical protein C1646_778040 [Rhizophagus diaphanus]|nr:hypothetical protein C1646_778040 [Rhizophagus diaphanus] [Rhizophagus sp. MUCL 43196]